MDFTVVYQKIVFAIIEVLKSKMQYRSDDQIILFIWSC